jgi:excisionase family DNA binding protein
MNGLMTLEEVAGYLRVTNKTIYRLVQKRVISAMRVGHQWRFDKATIDTWLRQNQVRTADILVIDDDETICSLFKDTLEGEGHSVSTISNPEKGLELVKNHNYDFVFLDLKMPKMDGAELFKQIKSIKPNLPVTIITAYPDSELMAKALAHGPLGVIGKPFRASDIIMAVNNYLHFGKQIE